MIIKCDVCGREFDTNKGLRAHMKATKHDKKGAFVKYILDKYSKDADAISGK